MTTPVWKQHKKIKQISFLVLVLIIFISLPISAQPTAYSSIKEQLAQVAGQIKVLQIQQDGLLRKNKELTDEISNLKRRLQKGNNLLLERRLQNDLKESREISDQIQELDKKIYGLTNRSVNLKNQLVSLLNKDIDTLSREADAAIDSSKRLQHLQRVLQLQKEKEAYQTQIAEESNELLLSLEIIIADNDGPDDIFQKAAIIEDQCDIMRAKIYKLGSQIRDIQKNINLQQNMLELLHDIGRGAEDELDLDHSLRIAERQEEIRDMESTLKLMQARRDIWKVREETLTMKAKQFYQEAAKMLQPVPKGDTGESK